MTASAAFDPDRLRALLDREVERPVPDVDTIMAEARRATRWSEAPLDTVTEWLRGRPLPAVADVASAFVIGWQLGGGTPSPALLEALVELVERLGIAALGPSAANTAILALAPVPQEYGGSLAERATRILREGYQLRHALGLQAGARTALEKVFRGNADQLN